MTPVLPNSGEAKVLCGACGREVRVRPDDGRLWTHGILRETVVCPGSGFKPEDIVGDVYEARPNTRGGGR